VWARVLGSAAGGGFPQWDCACDNCSGVRAGTLPARIRTQASIAVSPDSRRWFLVNATPDINGQLAALTAATGASAAAPTAALPVRRSPVAAVLLTDAELDHVAGLLSLREGSRLVVYGSAWIRQAAAPLVQVLSAYTEVDWREVPMGEPVCLDTDTGFTCRAIPTGSTKRPRYAQHLAADPAAVVGYRFGGRRGSPTLVYLPCVPELTDDLIAELADADCVFVDGTCWSDDEMARVGLAAKTSRSMGHAPVTGPGGTMERLATLAVPRRIYTHLNNTNPLLVEGSAQRLAVEAAGIEVAHDGMEIKLG
jgi:pyrroloquinoline quinone biosynthesis protein B